MLIPKRVDLTLANIIDLTTYPLFRHQFFHPICIMDRKSYPSTNTASFFPIHHFRARRLPSGAMPTSPYLLIVPDPPRQRLEFWPTGPIRKSGLPSLRSNNSSTSSIDSAPNPSPQSSATSESVHNGGRKQSTAIPSSRSDDSEGFSTPPETPTKYRFRHGKGSDGSMHIRPRSDSKSSASSESTSSSIRAFAHLPPLSSTTSAVYSSDESLDESDSADVFDESASRPIKPSKSVLRRPISQARHQFQVFYLLGWL